MDRVEPQTVEYFPEFFMSLKGLSFEI
jgi:hypothetical protein